MHEPILAAQYIRMSTEHQKYSPLSQQAAIAHYAAARGFRIIATYSDTGKSGLSLKGREGLSSLLGTVVNGTAPFKAILVLDVSRWGRFQDPDQSAHYEFICREAGVQVFYCVEQFENDCTPTSTLVKNLKRVMAGEFSRELGEKVLAGQITGARLGFKQGGCAPYGLRRMLVDEHRTPIMLMEHGETCPFSGYKAIYVHGPRTEVNIVRKIFRLSLAGATPQTIAKHLTDRGKLNSLSKPFNGNQIYRILKQNLYTGQYTYNKTTQRLHRPSTSNNESDWIHSRMMPPIIPAPIFDEVQRRRDPAYKRYSQNDLLDHLRNILDKNGRITTNLINDTPGPCANIYYFNFPSLVHAYREVGYFDRPDRINQKKSLRDPEMLAGLRRILEREGYISIDLIDQEPDLPLSSAYILRWGSLIKAYSAAGWQVSQSDLARGAMLRRRKTLESQRLQKSVRPMPQRAPPPRS
jgi:DNA invertase Pin-like site-specific DNA recombinase